MQTIEIVRDVLSSNLDIDGATVTADATLDSLGIDSLDIVEFTGDNEERCEIEFEQPESIVTVADLVAHIDSLK